MHLLAFAETIQLFPDGTIFIHIALILVMIWVLNRTFYKPINRIIAEREKSKGGRSSEATGILSQVEQIEARYTKEMLDVDRERTEKSGGGSRR
jgi:F0F1-type ATP synthase membrane subunit b/b'